MREVQGAIIGSGLIVFLIGVSGLLRLILKYISPITVAANIGIVGLALYNVGFAGAWPRHRRLAMDLHSGSALSVAACLKDCERLWRGVCSVRSIPHAPSASLSFGAFLTPSLPPSLRCRRDELPPAVPHAHVLYHPV